jgi:phenylpyruvate tautomerase PptA (4-oxalocrotonate tautomerase family)
MPSTLIEVRRPYTPAEEALLIDAVQSALVEAFKIPAADRAVRLIAHEPHRFACSPRLQNPERATEITIDCFTGRTLGAKKALYAAIVRNLEPLGIPPACVKIKLHEIGRENWGISGGRAACDVELGFVVEV